MLTILDGQFICVLNWRQHFKVLYFGPMILVQMFSNLFWALIWCNILGLILSDNLTCIVNRHHSELIFMNIHTKSLRE